MPVRGTLVSAVSGTVVALLLGTVTLPLVAILGGALVAFVLTRRYDVQRHYDAVGTVYFLSLGALVFALPFPPEAFKQTPQLFLTVFGVLSGLVVLVKRTVSVLLRGVGRALGRGDRASTFWNAAASIVGTLVLVWSLLKMKYRLTKTGAVGAATPLALGVNVLGHFWELPWVLEAGVDATAMVFIGGVIVGFHTLTSWYEVLALRQDPLVRAVAERSKATASTAAETSRDVAEVTAERSREGASAAAERSRDVAEATAERSKETVTRATETAVERSPDVAPGDVPGSGIMSRILGIDPDESASTS